MNCSFISVPDGPIGINYNYLYSCTFFKWEFFFYVLISLWIVTLMSLLANTASNYFSPTLASICDKLNLPYDIAGVTFLAFGNGAPDFFSLVASFSGGVEVKELGVGALLGGGVFVCTVVVGLVATFCPCDVSRAVFLRDISFHIWAVLCVVSIAIVQKITVPIAVTFVIFYCFYVIVVASASLLKSYRKKKKKKSSKRSTSESGDIALNTFNSNTVQTAFWHRNAATIASGRHDFKAEEVKESTNSLSSTSLNPLMTGTGGYSFLIVDPDEDDTLNEGGKGEKKDDDEEEDDEGGRTINFSGGFAPSFEAIIQEDYYAVGDSPGSFPPTNDEEFGTESIFHGSNNTSSRSTGSLSEQLIASSEGGGDMAMLDGVLDGSLTTNSLKKRNALLYEKVIDLLYWRQWMMQRRFRRGGLRSLLEWPHLSMFQRLLLLLSLPATILRDLTIPTLDDENWSKHYAVLHPFTIPLFIQFLFSYSYRFVGVFPIPLLCLFVGTLPAVSIHIMTHQNKAPRGRVFTIVWSLIAFVMCIFWIYMLAGELVACLSSVGDILHLPSSFLGLTVLAWGNSMGDLFANTAVARQGLGEMAIAGCYGGPVFNILIGLGVSLVYASLRAYPEPFPFKLELSSILSLCFLLVSLLSTVAIVSWRGYKIDKLFGVYLVTLYIVYLLCLTTLVVFQS